MGLIAHYVAVTMSWSLMPGLQAKVGLVVRNNSGLFEFGYHLCKAKIIHHFEKKVA